MFSDLLVAVLLVVSRLNRDIKGYLHQQVIWPLSYERNR